MFTEKNANMFPETVIKPKINHNNSALLNYKENIRITDGRYLN